MKKLMLFIVLILIFFSCDIFNKDRILEGEMFIVTRGSESIPLGLVDIALIEKDVFNEALENGINYFEEGRQILIQDLQICLNKLEELNEYEEGHWQKLIAEGKTKTVNSFYIKHNSRIEDLLTQKPKERDSGYAQKRLEDAKKLIEFSKGDRRWLLAQRRPDGGTSMFNYYRNLEFKTFDSYIEALEAVIEQERICKLKSSAIDEYERGEELIGYISKHYSSAKTNSRGIFSLIINNRKDYILVSKGSRNIGDNKELYFWVVPIEKGKDDITQLFLSNDNMKPLDEILSLNY